MAFDTKIAGSTSGNGVEADADNQLLVKTNTDPAKAGAVRLFSENDPGDITGTAECASPETDDDYRLRVATDIELDNETFAYVAQNTGKHRYANTTMTVTWSAAGMLTNATGITTTTTGVEVGTYAEFPLFGAGHLFCEVHFSLSALPTANTIIDLGMFRRSGANPYTPADGAYLEISASGVQGVLSHNGTPSSTAVFASLPGGGGSAYALNRVYRAIIAISEHGVKFWIDNILYGSIDTPVGQSQPFMSRSLPFSVRHAITGGAAGAVLQCTVRDYNVTIGGMTIADDLGAIGNRVHGSHQGLSGGTMGSLSTFTATGVAPTPAVPTNTTAALTAGLGGNLYETDTLAALTDGIVQSYQVPAGTVNAAGRRLRIHGVTIDSYVQATLTGGGYVAQWQLAFGHTAVSLATAEAATAKAPRRVGLGVQAVAAAAAASTVLTRVQQQFRSPIYVNPGEFVQCVKRKVGTAPSVGTIAHLIAFDYSWE